MIDVDDRAVMDALNAAVKDSHLSQAAFAQALGTSAPRMSTYLRGSTRPSARFVAKARRLGTALGSSARRGLFSAPSTASSVRIRLRDGEVAWAWRMLLRGRDHLALSLAGADDVATDAWEAAPTTTGSLEWDALLAALVSHEFDLPIANPRAAPLDPPWTPEHPFLDADRVMAATTAWLAERGIHVPARDLVTA